MKSAPASGRKIRIVASQSAHFTHTKTRARTVTLPAIASAYVRTRPVWTSLSSLPIRRAPVAMRVDRAEQDRALDPVTERDRQGHARPVEDPVVELVEVELVLEDGAHRPGLRDRERPGRVRGPGDRDPGDARARRARMLATSSCVPLGSTSGSTVGSRKSVTGVPEPGDLDPAADHGEHGEHADRPGHPDPRLGAFGPVEVLARPRRTARRRRRGRPSGTCRGRSGTRRRSRPRTASVRTSRPRAPRRGSSPSRRTRRAAGCRSARARR